MSESTTGTTAGAEPTTAPRPGRKTVLDMVRSLALVLAVVLGVVLLAPRPSEPLRQPVEVEQAAAQAEAADAPSAVPSLPDGWSPNSARFTTGRDDGVPSWHVGYTTPTQRYAGLEMARDATSDWVAARTSRGTEIGSQQVAGSTWTELLSPDGRRRSLVLEQDGVTTVVTGTALLDELTLLAEASTG